MHNVKPKSMYKKIGEIQITPENSSTYGELSQDHNPLHKTGVVYGMQLMLLVEEKIRSVQHWKQVTDFHYYFRQKVYVNQTVAIWFNVNGKFEMKVCNKKVGEGEIFGR